MGTTTKYKLTYPDRGEPMRLGRAHLQNNAETIEAALVAQGIDSATARSVAQATATRMDGVQANMLAVLNAVGAGQPGGGTSLDATLAALLAVPSSATSTALRRGYNTRRLVSDVPAPRYAGHQGSLNEYPPSAPASFAALAAADPDLVLDGDVQLLSDGQLAVSHDPTTGGFLEGTSVAINTLTAAQWRARRYLRLPVGSAGIGPYRPGTAAELFRAHGGRSLITLEAKGAGTAQPLIDAVKAAGITDSFIFQSAVQSECFTAAAAGLHACHVTDTPATAALLAGGVKYAAVLGSTANDAKVAAAVAGGLKVWSWGVSRQVDRDRLLALGVDGITSDDVRYVSGLGYLATRDDFASGRYQPGTLMNANSRGTLSPLGLDFSAGLNAAVGLYWLDNVGKTTWTLDWEWTMTATGASSSAGPFVHLGALDDRGFGGTIGGRNMVGQGGYRASMWQGGLGILERINAADGTATELGRFQTTTPAAGQVLPMRAVITPTTVDVYRRDTGQHFMPGGTAAATDSTTRGRYVTFGQLGVASAFASRLSNVRTY